MLLIEIDKPDLPMFDRVRNESPENFEVIQTDQFDGNVELLNVLVKLTPVVLGAVVAIVREAIRSKKHVVVKARGMVLQGVSDKTAERILSQYLEKDSK